MAYKKTDNLQNGDVIYLNGGKLLVISVNEESFDYKDLLKNSDEKIFNARFDLINNDTKSEIYRQSNHNEFFFSV